MKILAVLVLFCFLYLCQGSSPGVTVTLGSEALENGLSVDLPNILTSKLQNLTIASIAGTTRELVFLKIDYNITNIVLYNFEVGVVDVELINEGFQVKLSQIVCNATFDWEYKDQSLLIIHVSGSGTGTINFSDGGYEISMKILSDSGSPSFDLTKNELSLGPVDLHLNGGVQWFYDLFNFVITPLVKQSIDEQVQETVKDVVDVFDNEIKQIPTKLPLVDNIAFNWGLTSNFDTNSAGFGSFYSAGYFLPANDLGSSPPFVVPALPQTVNSDLFQVIISEYTFQSLGWALFEAGSLDVTFPFGTTTDWRVIVPALYRAYPKEDVQIQFQFPVYPIFSVNATGVYFEAAPYMIWNVVSDGDITNAFTLIVDIEASLNLYFNDTTQTLHGEFGVPSLDLTLQSSNIGDFSLFQLQATINTAVYALLLPTINGVLNQGIEIPSILGVTLQDPDIGYTPNYVYLTSNVGISK